MPSSSHRPSASAAPTTTRTRALCTLLMTRLCTLDRHLAGKPGTAPWDAVALGRFAARADTPADVRLAARLLLCIWGWLLRMNGLEGASNAHFSGKLTEAEWRKIRASWRRSGG